MRLQPRSYALLALLALQLNGSINLAAVERVTDLTVVPPPAVQPAEGSQELGFGGLRLSAALAAATWDDGLAEVAEYNLQQFRYGHLHPGSATLIVVRESFDPLRGCKSADAHALAIPVLKVHLVKSFQTGVYRYDQAVTTFLRRSDAVPLRLFMDSHEWCGVAAKSWLNHGAGSQMSVLSYFDGHGDLRQDLVLGVDGVLEDSLPGWLRAWLDSPRAPTQIQLVPSQVEARTVSTAAVPATLTRTAVRVALGSSNGESGSDQAGYQVTLASPAGEQRFVFTASAPHILVSWHGSDGSEMSLLRLRRFDYWAHHNPSDRP